MGISKGEITGRKNSPGRENKVGKVLGKRVGQEHGTAGRRKCIWYSQSQGVGGEECKMTRERVGVCPFWIGLESFR